MSAPRWLSLMLLALCGCSSSEHDPAPESQVEISLAGDERDAADVQALQARVAEEPDDLAARFALGAALERSGKLPEASREYAAVARALPRRRWTRPWLAFGRVELALGRDEQARAALQEVLETVPEERAFYYENEDYRQAAILLAPILSRAGAREELARLRRRFLVELEGDPGEWPVDAPAPTRTP